MSAAKKVTRKRKYSSPASNTTKVARRLEKLRSGQDDLWADDDDNDLEPYVRPKTTTALTTDDKTYIVLNDSEDDEVTAARRRGKVTKTHKKSSDALHEHVSSDQDIKPPSKCVTCLICSILKTLNSYNCCSKHLSVLLKKITVADSSEVIENGLPPQVMIVPVTDDLLQRYLDPTQIHQLKTQTTPATNPKRTIERTASSRSLSKKTGNISELSAIEPTQANKAKSVDKSCMTEIDLTDHHASSISIVHEPLGPAHSTAIPTDMTFVVSGSTSGSTNSFESPTVLDTCQIQQISDPALVVIDDSQSDQSQPTTKTQNPWIPISDETYAAVEIALNQPEINSEELTEFTPATARKTPTDVMASCLPKIQLKKGRYRQGKPLEDENKRSESMAIPASTVNVTEDRPITNSQSSTSSSSSTGSSVVITSIRPAPPLLATIVEDESLIIHPHESTSTKITQVLLERPENTTEGLSDTVMSCLFAQDDGSQSDYIAPVIKAISHEALTLLPPKIIIEDYSDPKRIISTNMDVLESSQFSNDQNDSQPVPSSTITERMTPSRISYRMNPDGTRVSISRPSPAPGHRSPLISLQRARIDSATTTTTHPSNPNP